MLTKNTPLNWLRAFEVSARHLNLSAAARELNVTPAAVSQQVRLLEHRLGKALFERNARGLRLTHAGDSLLPVCRESFERMDSALLELFGERKGNRLVVRVILGFARSWLLNTVAGFSRLHPDIPIRLVASVWPGEPLDTSVDVDLRLASSSPKGLQAHQLTRDSIFPVCEPRLAQRLKRGQKTVDWSSHTLLHTIGFMQGWQIWFAESQIKRRLHATDLEFDSAQLCLEAASLGHGIALARSSFVMDFLANKRLVALPGLRLEAKDNIFLTVAHGLSAQAPATIFREYLLSQTESSSVHIGSTL